MVYAVKNIHTGETMLNWSFTDIRHAKNFCDFMNEGEGYKAYKIVTVKA